MLKSKYFSNQTGSPGEYILPMNKQNLQRNAEFFFPVNIYNTVAAVVWLGLVLFALLALTLQGVHADLFVVLLESSQIFTGL